jgi:predicted transcriptional regulator
MNSDKLLDFTQVLMTQLQLLQLQEFQSFKLDIHSITIKPEYKRYVQKPGVGKRIRSRRVSQFMKPLQLNDMQ